MKDFHYAVFVSKNNVINDYLAPLLQTPYYIHTRLLARLTIGCLWPVLESTNICLLKLTTEEVKLLLKYIDSHNFPGALDPLKFFMATSVLFTCPSNLSESFTLVTRIAQRTVELIRLQCSHSILQGALCLLWRLFHSPKIADTMRLEHTLIKPLEESQNTEVAKLAVSVLWNLNHRDPNKYFLYAQTCLQYGFYSDAISSCEQILSDNLSNQIFESLVLVKGKAYAYLLKCEMIEMLHITALRFQQTMISKKTDDFKEKCAQKAKEAVKTLGFALDQGILDEEGSYLLDVAIINYFLLKQELKSLNRCFLCRRKGVKLRGSHIYPKFLLKNALEGSVNGIKFETAAPLHSISGKFREDTVNTCKCHLLCERCEQCLTQNGEDYFSNYFLPKISEVQPFEYGSKVYSFCVGIIFRCFVASGFFLYPNSREMYSILVACRKHLLSLPVKCDEKNTIPIPSPITEVDTVKVPGIYLILSPAEFDIAHFSNWTLIESVLTLFCNYDLSTPLDAEPYTNLCHAFIVHMAMVNIIVPLSPSQSVSLDKKFLINAEGGEYPLLSDTDRWKSIPQGLLQVFAVGASHISSQYLQICSGMNTTKGDSRKAYNYLQSRKRMLTLLEHGKSDIDTLQSNHPKEKQLISLYRSQSSYQVTLLPDGFRLEQSPPKLILKDGYKLLYHIHNDQLNATFFFIARLPDISDGKLVVIISFKKEEESFTTVDGVNLHTRESKDGQISIGYIASLFWQKVPEIDSKRDYLRLNTLSEMTKEAERLLIQRCGSLEVFRSHAEAHIRLVCVNSDLNTIA